MVTLNSCEEENLIAGASTNNGNTTTKPTTGTNAGSTSIKCYLREMVEVENGKKYTTKLTYNTKNILEKTDTDGAITTYEYDGSGRVSKQTITDGNATETYTYSYDSKGNMSNVKYAAKNTSYTIFITEYKITTSSSGQISKVEAVTEDGSVDFLLEYDVKDNVKKIIVIAGADGKKLTLIENVTFDDKPSYFANAGLKKAEIPLILFAAFFGENLTYYMNTNNVLSDKTLGIFNTEVVSTTYKYTKDNLPSKMTFVQTNGDDKYEGSSTYLYDCK